MDELLLGTIRTVLVLLAIVAGIILLYRYSGKLKLGLNMGRKGSEYGLKRAETVSLGYKKFVSVVEVKDRVLVLGIGEKEISLLAEWKKEENPT
jgi:flagellar biogenesis protein FliO